MQKNREKKGEGYKFASVWGGDACGMCQVFVFGYQIWRKSLSKGKRHEKSGMEFCKHEKKLWWFCILKTDAWKGVKEKSGIWS